MKKIDLYITVRFIKSFLLGLLAFLNIFILSSLFKVVGYIIDGKLSFKNGMIYLGAGLPDVIVNVVPLAVLLGGLMTVNKMATSSEIIALKTSGISFFRIVFMPLMFSAIISIGVFWFNDSVVPGANKLKREIKYTKIYDVKEARIKTDIYMKGSQDNLYYISMINGSSATINNMMVLIMNREFSKIEKVLIAEKGIYNINEKKWVLENVILSDNISGSEQKFQKYDAKFIGETPEDFLRDKIRENEMSINELQETVKFLGKTGGDIKKLLVALYKKSAYPFAALVMSFIGLSLGSRYVRGASAVSIGLSVVIGYSYYVVMATIEAFGIGGFLNPLLGAWIPNMIFIAIGIYTMRNAEY